MEPKPNPDVLMVILGAGASYDSANFTPGSDARFLQPPLTCDLFDPGRKGVHDLLLKYRDVGMLAAHLRPRLTAGGSPGFEALLAKVEEDGRTNIAARRQLFVLRFYLADLLSGIGDGWDHLHAGAHRYAQLVNSIQSWRCKVDGRKVIYVTFNYDTLLDRALETVLGAKLNSLDVYMHHAHTKLFRPHGCVDWSQRALDETMTPERLLASKVPSQLRLGPIEAGNYRATGGAYVPALSIPLPCAGKFSWPDEHARQFKEECFPQVTKVLVIGWAANEPHFEEILTTTPGRPSSFQICTALHSEEAGREQQQRMMRQWGWRFFHSRAVSKFGGLVDGSALEDFLEYDHRAKPPQPTVQLGWPD